VTESFLSNILDHKRSLVEKKKDFYHSLKWKLEKVQRPHLFRDTLAGPGLAKLIAEIKKASPSKGLIRESFDPVSIAKIYVANGAAAISVLTEDEYFLGKPEFIKQVSDAVNVPILAKDFFISNGQIYEACANGASAVLLIAAILDDGTLKDLIETADSLGIDCLVEVHDEKDLERACAAGAEIIGVNNRDLHAFVVDMQTCLRLIPKIPKGKVIVAESGFKTYEEIKALKKAGAHAVLIGETFMREQDIAKKIKEVMYGSS